MHTLHMWMQIVGKIRLELAPYENHWWQVPFYVNASGLTTSAIPYGANAIEISFDLRKHALVIECSNGDRRELALVPRSVAEFHDLLFAILDDLGVRVTITPMPVEVPDPIPFREDTQHAAYDPFYAERFFRALWQAHRVLSEFRGRFIGKASPVHFFWGGFDLAVTRFSGRVAPEHAPVPFTPARIVREAYSHEVSSAGFWPGGPGLDGPMFYSYAYPEPLGYRDAKVLPRAALYDANFAEFLLPYDAVRQSRDPDGYLLEFLQTTYAHTSRTAAP